MESRTASSSSITKTVGSVAIVVRPTCLRYCHYTDCAICRVAQEQSAVVALDDRPTEGQPDPCAFWFRGREWCRRAVEDLMLEAGPIITHTDLDIADVRGGARLQSDSTSRSPRLRDGLHAVGDQIKQHELEL